MARGRAAAALRVSPRAPRPAPCRPSVWVGFDGLDLAHELGHVFDLEHSSDPANLMHPDRPAVPELTEAQELEAEGSPGWLLACADDA